MKGSPKVIDALNAVYRQLLSIEQQAHGQEHRYEAMGYDFARWFHCIEEKGHEHLIHPLMNRINALGGLPDQQYAFSPDVFGDLDGETPESVQLDAALSSMVGCLGGLRLAYGNACDVAETDDDYGTETMIWRHIEWVEKKLMKFERRLRRLRRIGLVPFLAEYQ